MKPILFNTEMVRAILDGRKTQTRRVIKIPYPHTQYCEQQSISIFSGAVGCKNCGCYHWDDAIKQQYKVGDILWVMEMWGYRSDNKVFGVTYKADWGNDKSSVDFVKPKKWKPSIRMNKEIARIFLRVTNVRVERLQDISQGDAEKEGLYILGGCQIADTGDYDDGYWLKEKPFLSDDGMYYANEQFEDAEEAFASRWDDECKEGYKWEDNPYIFVYEFKKVEKPCETKS